MTPKEFLEQHELVTELKRQGATWEQLNGCRFWGTNGQHPFDLWSFTWPERFPPSALGLVKPFCALRWLVLEDPPASHDKDAAWRLVGDTLKSLNDARLQPVIETGKAFIGGRKSGTVGPIHKAISREINKDPGIRNEPLWKLLKAKPPKGWTFCENTRLGRYIEGPKGGEGMEYRRFCNIASEVRKKLKT